METYVISGWDFNPELISNGADEMMDRISTAIEACRDSSEWWREVAELDLGTQSTEAVDQYEKAVMSKVIETIKYHFKI